MAEQYFAREPKSRHEEREFAVTVRGRQFRFLTDSGVFAKRGLDRGTELLAEAMEIGPSFLTLDLGCGYGALGAVSAALAPKGRAVLTDVNARAVALAKRNLERNGLLNAEVRRGDGFRPVEGLLFDAVVTNPPIRAGKDVVQGLARRARDHLVHGGTLWMVVRTKQGAPSYRKFLESVYDEVREPAKGSGYRVLAATRRL
ncbi:MAG TPA: methyltransferase [Thermoplasmata archaeon]|nr:methyltransferase [Thermoplasmata archaeon]